MNITDFITELYCKIDDALPGFPKHPQALLTPSEVVTITLDAAVAEAYGWPADLAEAELLDRLLALNLERAE